MRALFLTLALIATPLRAEVQIPAQPIPEELRDNACIGLCDVSLPWKSLHPKTADLMRLPQARCGLGELAHLAYRKHPKPWKGIVQEWLWPTEAPHVFQALECSPAGPLLVTRDGGVWPGKRCWPMTGTWPACFW